LQHLHTLWKFPVILKAINGRGEVSKEYQCPPKSTPLQ